MLVSFVIPVYNGASTIKQCLSSFTCEDLTDVEVILVDDASDDGTPEMASPILSRINGRLIKLSGHSGAAVARNRGARKACGDILVFTDADCIIQVGLVEKIKQIAGELTPGSILGGTYTSLSADGGLFSDFQSVFINYSETKHPHRPDYIPTHLMIIRRADFLFLEGFREEFLPILEDVEFSHRARERGFRLRMIPSLQVGHIFNYTFFKSLKNAFRKSFYWTIYSLQNRDILKDSGTASRELKINSLAALSSFALLSLAAILKWYLPLLMSALSIQTLNLYFSRGLIRRLFNCGSGLRGWMWVLYYLLIYPMPALAGGFSGLWMYLLNRGRLYNDPCRKPRQ